MFALRPYQARDLDRLRESLRRSPTGRILYQLPTGGGKTVLMAHMAKLAAEKGRRVVFLVHRQELVTQSSATFQNLALPHGIIAPGFSPSTDPVQIASVDTLIRRFGVVPEPGLVIVDEAHHAVSAKWQRVFDAWPKARVVGLTATPERLDGRGLGGVFDDMVLGPSVRELMDDKHLSPYRIFAPPIGIDVQDVRQQAGDFARGELATKVDKPVITGCAVSHYDGLARDKRAIVFCVGIEHSKHVEAQFRESGVAAQHIDGTEDKDRRREIMRRFAAGEIKVLTNVDLVSEGFDVPAVEAVILLRPTQSLGLYLQQVGRALRPREGKVAIILDHAGNVMRHGLPDDPREWTLDGRKKRGGAKNEPIIPVKQCPTCFACHAPSPSCPACGHTYIPKDGRGSIKQEDGKLEEVDASKIHRKREVGQARSLDDLLRIEKARGYKSGWANHVFQSRVMARNP